MKSKHIAHVVATCFFIGYAPLAPGTIASIATAFFLFYLPMCSLVSMLIAITVLFLIGTWFGGTVEHAFKKQDPSCVVIDEVVGMALALIAVPKVWWTYALAVLIFRVLDIYKPFPIAQAETRWSGGMGIMMDDVIAGLMSRAIIWIILIRWPL